MEKSPWVKDKILKLTFSNDFDDNIKELQYSNHSLRKENGKNLLRVKVPYNYNVPDHFKLNSLKLLVIQKNWITNMSIIQSHCSRHQ